MWADSVGAKKMRATARAMGSYTARLRPYFDKLLAYVNKLAPYLDKALACVDKLRPYANGLRRHAVKAVDAAWSWLHRGIVQVGKVSPRAAKRLEGVETWVCRSEGRKLGTAAFAVVLVLGVGFAAIFSGNRGRYGRVIFTSNRVVPLPDETRRAAGEKAKQLAAALDTRLDKKLAGEAWTSARILVALGENDPGYAGRTDVEPVEQYFRSVAGPSAPAGADFPKESIPITSASLRGRCGPLRSTGSRPQERAPVSPLGPGRGRRVAPVRGRAAGKVASSYGTAAAILALPGNRLSNPTASRGSGSPPRCSAARTG